MESVTTLPKRPRSSSDGSSGPGGEDPPTKASRTSPEVDPGLVCTLPPTCNPPYNRPTLVGSMKDLESHYSKFHAHVCEEGGCKCVFPDARLLQLVSVFLL